MARSPVTNLTCAILMLAAVVCGCSYYQETEPSNTNGPPPSRQTTSIDAIEFFGNISEAAKEANNFYIAGEGSAFSYNNSRGTVNWVAWKTTRADLGPSVERPDF